VGNVLSCTTGTWTGTAPITYAYVWKNDGTPIGGATASTYTTVSGDVGHSVTCAVAATNSVGSASATSNGTTVAGIAPVNTVAPVASGATIVGSVLSTTDGTWTGTPSPSFAYKWQRDGVDIGGATSSSYTSVAADAGHAVRPVVTATNAGGSASANGNAITVTGTLVSWDFTAQSVGVGTASPLVLTRASLTSAADQSAGTLVLTGLTASDTVAIDKTAAGNVGLQHYPTRTNQIVRARPVSSSGGGWSVSGASPAATFAVVSPLGPDGSQTGAQVNPGSAHYACFNLVASVAAASYTGSAWVYPGTISDWQIANLPNNAGNSIATHGTLTAGKWQRVQGPTGVQSSTTGYYWIPNDGRDYHTVGGIAAEALDAYYDAHQLEAGLYPSPFILTTSAAVTRAGQKLTTPNATTVTSSGKVSIYVELEIPSTFANADSAMRIWSDPNDATTYVELATNGTLTVSVGGATNTCSITGDSAGALFKLWVKAGGSAATVVEYKFGAGSVVTPSITGSALGAIAPSGVLEVACSSTTKQLAGTHLRGGFLVDGVNPSAIWSSASGF
jgi:hypothetical protein